ncbi:IS630 transposase-related protein [Moraxella bovis]|uniref:Transposase and inactivated derivatives n=1 Tax=Moraxella bovis TaxID=476 RepID=A0A378PNX5_MORBO|nr:IS630 transposase-related protein [Moraxella bovis]STY90287.1 Transposase and inactivated derivatives [Moraxella bovis]
MLVEFGQKDGGLHSKYNQQTLKQHQLSPYLHHHPPITTYMAYSLEIRQKALAYYDKCKNIDLVIEAFGVSRHTVFRWRRQLKETGICLVKNQKPDCSTHLQQYNDKCFV